MQCAGEGCEGVATHLVVDREPDPSTQNLVLVLCPREASQAEESGYHARLLPKRRRRA